MIILLLIETNEWLMCINDNINNEIILIYY